MRTAFSLEVVDLNHQAPNRNKRESKYFWDELYGLISAGGFDYIEVPYEAKWDFGGRSGIPRSLRSLGIKFGSTKGYLEHLNKRGLKGITCIHMDPTLFCSGPMDMYFGAFGHFAQEAILMAEEAGSPVVSLTATATRFSVKQLLAANGATEEDFLKRTKELFIGLAQEATKHNVTLCIKNEYWGLLAGEKILSFVEEVENGLLLDVDTAHLQIAGVDVAAFIQKHAHLIGVVHMTDTAYEAKEEDINSVMPEFPPSGASKVFRDIGDGQLDFAAILKALQQINYTGEVVYNCKESYDIYRSILRTRRTINCMQEV